MEIFINFSKTFVLVSILAFIGIKWCQYIIQEDTCREHYLGNYDPALETQCRAYWDDLTRQEFGKYSNF